MKPILIDSKKLYEVNQYVKNNPYYFDLVEQTIISNDGQSDILISCDSFKIEVEDEMPRYIFIEDGKKLYTFLSLHKKQLIGADNKKYVPDMYLNERGFTCNGEEFPVKFTGKIDMSLLSDEPTSSLKELDCKKANLYYDGDIVKEGDIVMNDIIEIVDLKKQLVQNLFVFMEIIDGDIHLHETKLGLSLENKTLICLHNFEKLKNKKTETEEYMQLHVGMNRLYVSYGNSEYDFIYKFHLHDLHNRTGK
jgi:hypothetical protein